MRVMLCCVTQYYGRPSYELLHIAPALKSLKYDVKVFPLVESEKLENVDSKFIDTVNLLKPDYILIRPFRNLLSPEAIKYVSKVYKTVALFGDDEKLFDRGNYSSSELAPSFTYITTTFKPAVKLYHNLGIKKVLHSGYGANHEMFRRVKVKQDKDVCFIGACRDPRIDLMDYLANEFLYNKIRINVYGYGWHDEGYNPTDSQYIELINRTKINLGIDIDDINGTSVLQIKGRDFEIPMCGGFLLTTYNDLLKDFYKLGSEVETYKDKRECADKIIYYLKHEDKRRRIAEMGYKRALRSHKYTSRFKDMFRWLKQVA